MKIISDNIDIHHYNTLTIQGGTGSNTKHLLCLTEKAIYTLSPLLSQKIDTNNGNQVSSEIKIEEGSLVGTHRYLLESGTDSDPYTEEEESFEWKPFELD